MSQRPDRQFALFAMGARVWLIALLACGGGSVDRLESWEATAATPAKCCRAR